MTLFGYGIQVRVESGHLILEDGIGDDRRYARFPRVGHGLQRLIVIGADGMVSLAALRWLTVDQNASFVMLDRAGSVLMVTGPTRKGDVHIRRAQALARQSGAGIQITQDLIDKKLRGQEQVGPWPPVGGTGSHVRKLTAWLWSERKRQSAKWLVWWC